MDSNVFAKLLSGCVIPAHPLALTSDNQLNERHQKALTRYYLAAGAGGLAVGVHTTQFAIHEPKIGLYQPVLELAAETAGNFCESNNLDKPIMVAGIAGPTDQAVKEATLACELGYDIGLVSLTALRGSSIDELISHVLEVGKIIDVMGFYLQETISKMVLPGEFWRKLLEIPQLRAIKAAPFNRYHTLDVLEAVAQSGRENEIALYTGNDDTIIQDLLTRYKFKVNGKEVTLDFKGGLLGQWACWTSKAVEYLELTRKIKQNLAPLTQDTLSLAGELTLANKAIFDADHHFTGCIPGISHVLKRQGLMKNVHSLDSAEKLSPNQADTIDKIIENYPHLTDDVFVRENLENWLA